MIREPRSGARAVATWPWHPFLIGLLPVLHFWERNFRVAGLDGGLRLIAIYAAAAGLLLLLLRRALRDWGRAGLVTTPLVAVVVAGTTLGVPVSAALVLLALVLAVLPRRLRSGAPVANASLNAAVLVLVAFPVVGVVREDAAERAPHPAALFARPAVPTAAPRAGLPDVYYLVIDGLGQPATVRELFGVPPGTLTEGLRRRGARVLDRSFANYPQTGLSVAATLNLATVDQLLEIPDVRSRDRRPLAELVGRSRAVRTLRRAGYRIVTYPSGYPLTHIEDPDARREPALAPNFLEFYVLNDGVIPLLSRAFGRGPADVQYALHRHRLNYILENLPAARDGAAADEPVFVFAHLLAPHPPFVWGPGGAPLGSRGAFSFGDGNDWVNANPGETTPYGVFWKNQAAYVMRRLAAAVDAILAASPRPPVIIIQGDHGPGSQLHWDYPQASNLTERFGIFNAWILPPGLEVPLREDMTALATFPALFAALFGVQEIPIAEGLWFARMKYPYEYFAATTGP